MATPQYFKEAIFQLRSRADFEVLTLEMFRYQAEDNKVYKTYLNHLGIKPYAVNRVEDIPYLPIGFFKSQKVVTGALGKNVTVFSSSATGGLGQSKHLVTDIPFYHKVCTTIFEEHFGKLKDLCFLALLPSYLERQGSSLIEMCQHFIEKTGDPDSGFYLNEYDSLVTILSRKAEEDKKVVLLGVSFGLLDFAENNPLALSNTVILETGGMKGRRKEMVRTEVHDILKASFKVTPIGSEYGMTELLSQAYSLGNGIFETPPWMSVAVRETDDPFAKAKQGKTGGLNIIDLANVDSCAFIETMDLGRKTGENSFEVLGRFDHAEIRGCNLLTINN